MAANSHPVYNLRSTRSANAETDIFIRENSRNSELLVNWPGELCKNNFRRNEFERGRDLMSRDLSRDNDCKENDRAAKRLSSVAGSECPTIVCTVAIVGDDYFIMLIFHQKPPITNARRLKDRYRTFVRVSANRPGDIAEKEGSKRCRFQ